mmetsp:Transcript_49072/g.113715  ORF Transcript_49072/g.113715 Transcript_49072/m.113715 type:complete len:471 (+) Transcript_49072:168-1580(+)
MEGVWLEDGTFRAAPGQKAKGKGKKGRGKAKSKGQKGKDGDDDPPAKKAKMDEEVLEENEEESEESWFDREWMHKEVCLVNLKATELNGSVGKVKQHMGVEEVIIDGKKKQIRRFLVSLEGSKGEKSIKMENLFKVMTGALVKLRGLDSTELNDTVAECGRLDVTSMRYDVTLSDGRHIKVKPANVDFVARYESSQVAGSATQMEWIRSANSLRDKLAVIEEFQYPVPTVMPARALEDYAKKYPKSVVIGKSNAANPKGMTTLVKELMSSLRVPPGARLLFASLPRDRGCVSPPLADARHDELLRLGSFAEWIAKRCAPRPVYFLLPGAVAKGPPSVLSAAACAWPLYVSLCADVIIVESERWRKSNWARVDALLAVWARRPLYILPEKYRPPVELPDTPAVAAEGDEQDKARQGPLSLRPEEPLTIERPQGGIAGADVLLMGLAERAAEAEAGGSTKVQCPALAVRRLG